MHKWVKELKYFLHTYKPVIIESLRPQRNTCFVSGKANLKRKSKDGDKNIFDILQIFNLCS